MTVTPDGRLLVLPSQGPFWALLLDPRDYHTVALRMPESPQLADLLTRVEGIYFGDRNVFLLVNEGIVHLRVVGDGATG